MPATRWKEAPVKEVVMPILAHPYTPLASWASLPPAGRACGRSVFTSSRVLRLNLIALPPGLPFSSPAACYSIDKCREVPARNWSLWAPKHRIALLGGCDAEARPAKK